MCIYIYSYMYIYTYIHTHIQTYMYMHIRTQTVRTYTYIHRERILSSVSVTLYIQWNVIWFVRWISYFNNKGEKNSYPQFKHIVASTETYYLSSPELSESGLHPDTSLSDIALSCCNIWTMERWPVCSLFCFCFLSVLTESLSFLFRIFLRFFSWEHRVCSSQASDRVWCYTYRRG